MDRQELTNIYTSFLEEEGYRPNIDDDGDIYFKREGKTYLIFVDSEDSKFFRLVFPNFWPIESEEERLMVLHAANAATAQTKTAKVYMVQDNVWASVELFIDDPSHFKALFGRCMDALGVGVQTFVTAMKAKTLN